MRGNQRLQGKGSDGRPPEPRQSGQEGKLPWWPPFLLCLFATGFVWRLIVLSKLSSGPLLEHLSADADTYWRWATELRSGRLLGNNPFFLGPLFAYWLTILRTLVGDAIRPVLMVQAALGATTVVFLTDAARRIASARGAVPVGLALCGYSMAVLFDLLILMESLLLFAGSLIVWLVVRSDRRRPTLWSPILAGALIGLMTLGRPTSLLLLFPYAYHVFTTRPRLRAAYDTGLVAVIVILVSLPIAMHHHHVAREWIPTSYSLGFNFYVGNGPEANGTYGIVTGTHEPVSLECNSAEGGTDGDGRSYLLKARGLRLSPGASSRYWLARAWEQIQDRPWGAVRLYLRKLALLMNRRELPQIENPKAYEGAAGALGWPLGLEFAFFGVLGLAAVPLAWRAGSGPRFVVILLLVMWFGTAMFFVVDRYRIHLLVALAPLAAFTIDRTIDLWRSRRSSQQLFLVAGLGVGTVLAFAPLAPHDPVHEEWCVASELGEAWLARGETARALLWLDRAVAIDRDGHLPGIDAASARPLRASVYENLGIALSLVGDQPRAIQNLRHAVALAPDAVSLRTRLADQLALSGAWEEAVGEYRASGARPAQAAERLLSEAVRCESRGDTNRVASLLRAAMTLRPADERAVIPLVRLEIQRGSPDTASAMLERAERSGLEPNLVRVHRAWIAITRGDMARADRMIASIPDDVLKGDPRIASTLKLMHCAAGP